MPTFASTILDVCGPAWLAVLGLAAGVNFVVAIRLTFGSQSIVALVAFFPIAALPLWIGIIGSLLNLSQAIELGTDRELAGGRLDTSVLIAMALLPTFVGAVLTLPAYATAAYGRFWLATRGRVELPTAKPESKPATSNADEFAYQQYAESVASEGYRKSR